MCTPPMLSRTPPEMREEHFNKKSNTRQVIVKNMIEAACPDLPVVLVVVVVDEQPHDHGRHEAHGVAQRVDHA